MCENIFPPLNMIAAVASSLLWKFQTPLRQTATHLFVLLTDDAYEYIVAIFNCFLSNKDERLNQPKKYPLVCGSYTLFISQLCKDMFLKLQKYSQLCKNISQLYGNVFLNCVEIYSSQLAGGKEEAAATNTTHFPPFLLHLFLPPSNNNVGFRGSKTADQTEITSHLFSGLPSILVWPSFICVPNLQKYID